LKRLSIAEFNKGIREFSVQALYSRCKNELKRKYPELMPSDLHYSVKMSEAFEEFKVPSIKLKEMEFKMRGVRKRAVSRHLPMAKKADYKKEYNILVREFNQLLEPQQKLIKRYKKLRKTIN
jgi:hypothetical protein